MAFEDLTTQELEARHRRLSEHFVRAQEDRRLMAAVSVRDQLDAVRRELKWRESSAEGAEAYRAGLTLNDNPNTRSPLRHSAWVHGFQQTSATEGK